MTVNPEAWNINRAIEALAEIAAGGEISPEAVVDAARDPKSPLHANFEWDDHVAAEAYRVDKARDLIEAIDRPSP